MLVTSSCSLDILRLEDNNLTGTVPFVDCDNFHMLSSDCSAPRSIICPCCTRCFGFFTINTDVLPCPSSVLQVTALDQTKQRLEYFVENEDNQLITEHSEITNNTIASCISPSDCMTITSTFDDPFSVAVDGTVLFDKLEGEGEKRIYGYASIGTMQPNTCDDYAVCNRSLRPGTHGRILFNLITRFSGLVSKMFQVCINSMVLKVKLTILFRTFLRRSLYSMNLYAGGWMTLIQKMCLHSRAP